MATGVWSVADTITAETNDENSIITEGAVRRKRGPYKLYSFNPEDEGYNAKIPKTTKWRRRLHRDGDAASSEQSLGNQTSTVEQNEELQSRCSSPSFSMGDEDQDFSGKNLKRHSHLLKRLHFVISTISILFVLHFFYCSQ